MNFSMLKRLFYLVIPLCLLVSANSAAERFAMCPVLKRPNSLLFDRFLKIRLKRICNAQKRNPTLQTVNKTGTACWYKIPRKWANSINYMKMADTGMMICTNDNTTCPILTYLDYQDITFHTRKKIDGRFWKTKQSNRIGRMLRKRAAQAPAGSVGFIEPKDQYTIRYLKLGKTKLPLIFKK